MTLDILITDLRATIADLGKNGGQIGPSVYDTAQVLRLAPPTEGVWPGIQWLLDQQHSDGSWGDLAVPMARDIPTLAAVLALDTYVVRKSERSAVDAAVAFLRRQAAQWAGPLPEDIPLAAELLLPALVDAARERGIDVDNPAYASLRELGQRRRGLLMRITPHPGTPLAHSWEGWGREPDVGLLDAAGSIGHSPAATAAWLAAADGRADIEDAAAAARRYLAQASAATGADVPGVVGAVWPYARNEQIVSLFTLLLAGLLDHPALRDAVQPLVDDLWRSLRPEGHGISDLFATDGDLTAMSFAVLARCGYRPALPVLKRYIVENVCMTYPHEMQRSLSATTHAAYTLAALGGEPAPLLDYLGERRDISGVWRGDKWHASWLYLTSHTVHTMLTAGRTAPATAVLTALFDHQRRDGGWGVTSATVEETAYAALALLGLERAGLLPDQGRLALRSATRFLMNHYRPLADDPGAAWIAKGLYRPTRIARIEEVAATMACVILMERNRD